MLTGLSNDDGETPIPTTTFNKTISTCNTTSNQHIFPKNCIQPKGRFGKQHPQLPLFSRPEPFMTWLASAFTNSTYIAASGLVLVLVTICVRVNHLSIVQLSLPSLRGM